MPCALQTTSLRGVGVVATVEESVKGALPPFDQGTVGINVMPLGSAEVWQDVKWHDFVSQGVSERFNDRNMLPTKKSCLNTHINKQHRVFTW